MISILGMPTDKNSSFLIGAAQAPSIIMEEFNSKATNKFSENGIDLGQINMMNDFCNLDLKNQNNEFELIRDAVQIQLQKGNVCISIGGDHSITYPIIAGYNKFFPKINILHFDAHPDLYKNFNNNHFSHASPFARIMENQIAK